MYAKWQSNESKEFYQGVHQSTFYTVGYSWTHAHYEDDQTSWRSHFLVQPTVTQTLLCYQ